LLYRVGCQPQTHAERSERSNDAHDGTSYSGTDCHQEWLDADDVYYATSGHNVWLWLILHRQKMRWSVSVVYYVLTAIAVANWLAARGQSLPIAGL